MANKKIKTQLNKNFRLPFGINARKYKDYKIHYVEYVDNESGRCVERFLDENTENGGTMTPFNIQCTAVGACAVRNIIFDGDDTIVVFCDGDRVVLHRHEGDNQDPVTAVLWALGQKVFGKNLVRQIRNAIQYRGVNAQELHANKMLRLKNIENMACENPEGFTIRD